MLPENSRRQEWEKMTDSSESETVEQDDRITLEETFARIEQERCNAEMMPTASSEDYLPSFRSIESFLYRVSKVFEDKRPVGDQGQAMDKKMYMRQEARKRELGMQ